jgi:hypothetical protein
VTPARELVQLRALVTDVSPAPAALTRRVQRIERVSEMLHANLAAARQWLATFLPRDTEADGEGVSWVEVP